MAESLASCGHPANEDGECDCSSWPERAPFANLDPAADGGTGHRIGAVTDTRGRITDIYATGAGPDGPGVILLLDSTTFTADRVLDLDAAIELATYLGLAIARAQDPRP